jgi:hypothetical protein
MIQRKVEVRRIEVVDEAVAEILRHKTPAERIEMAFQCGRTFRAVIARHIRMIHPDWSDEEVAEELARRTVDSQDYEWRLASL